MKKQQRFSAGRSQIRSDRHSADPPSQPDHARAIRARSGKRASSPSRPSPPGFGPLPRPWRSDGHQTSVPVGSRLALCHPALSSKECRLPVKTRSQLRCSVELWEIILHGYREPQDPIRLTSTEFYNRQLNASARDKIRSGINRKLLDQVNDIGSAKELWDRIIVLQEGTDLIQSSLYETAKQEAHRFMIREGESVADAYARLGALRVRIKGLGAEKYDDGFEMNEGFIKSKVIAMIAVKQEDTNLALNLQIMTKSADLNSDDLVSYVAANENMAKAGKMLMAMNRVDEASHNHEASHNLALKARADHGGEEEYEIEEDEEMTSTSDIATDFAFFAKKYKGKLPMLLNDKKKKRTCYNCDEESHFANECPYEKRVDKPKFIKGVKPRLKPNPINDRYKRNKGRAFVGAEYLSDEEEEDEEKEAGVAGLAFSKPGSLFTYDYSKDYSTENDVGSSFMARITQDDDSDDSSSSTTVGSCLMARETKVMEPPPSLSSVLDNEAENQDELTVLKELYNVRCTLRGEALVKFDFLMDSLKEKDESIEELEYHLNDKERRFNLLRQELKTERCISQGLKQQIETYELDKVKDLETIERAQSLTQELNASKEELEVAHASLTRDLDHLERANKLVKDELKKLGKNHDLLQETYSKALESMNDSIVDKNVASSSTTFTSEHAKLVAEHVRLQEELSLHVETNTYLESLVTKYGLNYYPNESACEQATTLEENVRLKKELAKFTTTKSKMGLDDLLNQAHEDEHSQEIEEAQIEGQDGDPNDQVDQVTPPRPKRTKEEIEARRLARRDRTLEIRGHTHDKVLGDVRAKLMTDRFEMSMMGEMKFFLGFEIKQLREGTFINQAKYLQDMLKRFKMTELKGVATPMVTKCHLALDPNGGASRGGRRRSRHDRSSDEFASNAPRKSVTSRRKNKEVRENYKAMDPVSYSAIRMKNWYEDVPRDEEIEGRRYWCIEQEFIYKDVYEPMKNLRPMQAINVDILAENDHFEDAIWVAGRMGLLEIMKIQCDYSPDLVKQFFATLAIRKDEEHTMEWMTGSTHCSATLRQFAGFLGVPVDGGRRLHGPQQTDKNALVHLYTSAGKIGRAKGLLPIYSQLLRFFRATICPSGGNNDALRGALVDLMHLSYKCARDVTEERDYTLDVMDFIFHEIHDAMVSRTTIPYAPYIHLLINNYVAVCDEDLSGYPLVKHHVKKAYRLKPVSSAVPAPDTFMGDARSSGFAPARHPDVPAMRKQVSRLSWFQRHILCMNIEIHKENYAASRERSEIKHTRAVILHKLSGDQGPPPQPPAHQGYIGWHSAGSME
ncbi:hypothetical protein QYE76_065788 [Lolium multiflorum]|uniref:CCHC-type domain-containing protein n=1 Tax=Lolium multiflorum TaxID=4521 RepID=A0AAD8SAZ5_LOLMU|nr:hypothetical protein QYE76_065788 [Lolium multiflorum]